MLLLLCFYVLMFFYKIKKNVTTFLALFHTFSQTMNRPTAAARGKKGVAVCICYLFF